MADIQLATTLGANSGTGPLMKGYKLAGDSAVYRESAPTAQPSLLTLKRTEPKPTKDYAGAQRGEAKYTRSYADTQGRLWPAIVTVTSSLPAFLTDAQKSAFITESLIAAGTTESKDTLSKLMVPQS